MRREQEIIESHSGFGCVGVSVCVLRTYRGRVEETCRRDGVAAEAEYVQGREIDCEPERGFALVVGDRLWVKRRAPVKR
jgi:hypothetical protein